MERICFEFGIEYISPSDVFKGSNKKEAFEKYLYELVEKAFFFKTEFEIDILFYPNIPPINRVINSFEIKLIKNTLEKEDLIVAIKKFRAKLDGTIILKDLEEEVVLMFYDVKRV